MNEENKNVLPAEEVSDENEIIAVRHQKLADLKSEGKDPFAEVSYDVTAHAEDIFGNYAAYEEKEVSLAGRIMSRISAILSASKASYSPRIKAR